MSRTAPRRAVAADARPLADLWLASYTAGLPTVRRAHPDDEVRAWFADHVLPAMETWVVDGPDGPLGLLVLAPGWIEQLYVAPEAWGRGIGRELLALARDRSPAGLQLWTFQVNRRALAFYAAAGFVEVERTDGSGNEEREPDVRLAWAPPPG